MVWSLCSVTPACCGVLCILSFWWVPFNLRYSTNSSLGILLFNLCSKPSLSHPSGLQPRPCTACMPSELCPLFVADTDVLTRFYHRWRWCNISFHLETPLAPFPTDPSAPCLQIPPLSPTLSHPWDWFPCHFGISTWTAEEQLSKWCIFNLNACHHTIFYNFLIDVDWYVAHPSVELLQGEFFFCCTHYILLMINSIDLCQLPQHFPDFCIVWPLALPTTKKLLWTWLHQAVQLEPMCNWLQASIGLQLVVTEKFPSHFTAGAGWCFPWKNPLRDMFCDFQRVFPMETQKVFLKEKSEKHIMCFSQVSHR